MEVKPENCLTACSLSSYLIWESLVGCVWLLLFDFLRLQCAESEVLIAHIALKVLGLPQFYSLLL